jgi:hypothetical protein
MYYCMEGGPYKMKMLKPRVAAPPLIPTDTRFMTKIAPQNPVWALFMMRKGPGFSASRKKRIMARTSSKRQATIRSISMTTDLIRSAWVCDIATGNLRNPWLDYVLDIWITAVDL